MAQIKKDTSLKKAILQAAITGKLISTVVEPASAVIEPASAVIEPASAVIEPASAVVEPASAVVEPASAVVEPVETTIETGRQLLDRIIEERNKKLLEETKKNHTDLQISTKSAGKKNEAKKELPPITEDEIPFEIPENWCWCRLGDLGEFTRGSGIKRNETTKDGFPCVRYGEMYTTYKTRFSHTKSFTSKDVFDKCHKIHTNDVLMALTGENKWDIALAAVYEGNEELALGGDLCKFSPNKCNSLFLVYLINSPYGIEYKRNTSTGDIIVHTSTTKLANLLVPLPPLAVQNAIVAKLEQVLPLVDAYENAVLQKEELKSALKDNVKKAILQEAVQGKLVPQIAGEGNAKDLLAEIKKNHTDLQISTKSAGKKNAAKKELPPITEDEIPFEIPENWCWCRLGELCKFLSRGKSPKYSEIKKYPVFAQKCNLKDGEISLEQAQFLDPEVLPKWKEEYKIQDGDVLVNSTGTGTVMRTRYFKSEYLGDYPFVIPDSHVTVIRTFEEIVSKYIYYCCIGFTVQNYWEQNLAGSTNQKELYIGVVGNTPIPLPPLAEQKRIVAAIEQLLPLCERLGE